MQSLPVTDSVSAHFQISYQQLRRRRHARLWMTLSLIFTDLVSLSLAFGLAFFLRSILPGGEYLPQSLYINLIPIISFFIIYYVIRGLYPTVGMSPVDELRLLSGATSTVFILFMAATFWLRDVALFSRLLILIAWPLALVLVQLDRWFLRILARQMGFWGEPVAIVGAGPETQKIETYLKQSSRLGIWPVAIIDGRWSPDETFQVVLEKTGIRTAILIVPEMSEEMKHRIIDLRQYRFQRLILISPLGWVGSLGVVTYDLEGLLGLEIRQNLLNKWDRFLKRCLDLIMVIVGGIAISPLLVAIAILIRLDSPGSIIYKQERVGRNRRTFKTYKFRTMVSNADQVLQEYLALHPNLKAEWDATQKLKNDPRVTRGGKILRKFSLDEFPQIWNVLKGEMSIVGPRPCLPEQRELYGNTIHLYEQVRPGLTGLWQVSGRNNTDYDQRIRYDEYYIRNWSIWLDIYILLRTVWVVLSQRGAY
jgi:Undecaprenyl-phosphate galactose phosphotransferase WbaP